MHEFHYNNDDTFDRIIDSIQGDNAGLYIVPYGEESIHWINTFRAVPYVEKGGTIEWNVPFENVKVGEVINTFRDRIDLQENTLIRSVDYYDYDDVDRKRLISVFIETLSSEWKKWFPKIRHQVRKKRLLKLFLLNTSVCPRFVVDAILIRTAYNIETFMRLFGIDKRKDAKDILEALGYEKKANMAYYDIRTFNRQELYEAVESSESCLHGFIDLSTIDRCKSKIASGIRNLGVKIENWGDELSYKYCENGEADKPVYKNQHDDLKLTIRFILIELVVAIAFIVIVKHVFTGMNGTSDISSAFISSLMAAIVGGTFTVITTYWIINRDLRIDFHQERLSVMPIFNVKCIFTTDLKDNIPNKIKKIIDSDDCTSYVDEEPLMLLEYSNIGYGPAFNVESHGTIAGMYGGEIEMASFGVSQNKYEVVEKCYKISIRLQFYDLYGNYYYQMIYGGENEFNHAFVINADPPIMVKRTSRIRYQQ